MEQSNREEQIQVITPNADSFADYFRKIWRFRALIWVFARRDIKVKYAQTAIGISWSIIQPLTALLIYSFFFGYILNWTSGELPFSLYVLSGLLGWNFFSYSVTAGSTSIQESSHIIKKIYFPKSILPLSKLVMAGVDMILSFALLIPLMIYYGQMLSWKIIFLPLVLVFNAMCALTLVFWVAAFAYRKRDLFHVLPFIVYFGVWLTPVFFTNDILPENLRFLMEINPMSNVVNAWRWMLFDSVPFSPFWLINFGLVSLLCLMGMYYYNKKESSFSDFV
jgi:lipopolysaccharide transport system permease protein